MRKPLKDIDIVLLLPIAMADWKTAEGARLIHEQFKEPLRRHFGSRVSFDKTAQAGKALQLCFTDVEFTIDLVAAFETANRNWVKIADRNEGLWEPSNTRQLIEVVAQRNQDTDGRLIHQVRMVKEFVAQDNALEDLCGLATESLTFAAVLSKVGHARAVAATLSHAASAVWGPVMDPTGVDDLAAKWTVQQRQRYAHAFSVGATKATEALRLESDARFTDAIATWSEILGEDFPRVPEQSAAQVISGMATGGTVTSTGRVTPSTHGAGGGRPGRAWRRTP